VRLGRFGSTPEAKGTVLDLVKEIHALPPAQRREAFVSLSAETKAAIAALDYEWLLQGRPEQLPPPAPWRWWVMCGGRGGGKTRAASEEVLEWAYDNPGTRMAIIGKDAGSVRRIMVLGGSGILRRSPPWFKPKWYKTDKLIVWPNDTMAETHSAEEPNTLRGPEYHKAWITELFHWGIPRGEKEPTAWREGIKLSLRLGENPQGIVDSSPRGTEFCINFLLGPKDPRGNRSISQAKIDSGDWRIEHTVEDQDGKAHKYVVACRRWASERNSENLAPGIVAEWRQDLRGSRLESQELDGIILTKVTGALWSLEAIDALRLHGIPCRLKRVIVAVDPTRAEAPVDEAGIVVAGLGDDGIAYILEDCSLRGSPETWIGIALEACFRHRADELVYEKNRMGDAVRQMVRSAGSRVKLIEVTASEGKRTRAEPVSALYEREKVRHVGTFPLLEDEMVSWDPTSRVSPNRMDALVWAVTALMLADRKTPIRLL
jgi:phage terminase large subunit-like protein